MCWFMCVTFVKRMCMCVFVCVSLLFDVHCLFLFVRACVCLVFSLCILCLRC